MKKLVLALCFLSLCLSGCSQVGSDRPEIQMFTSHKSDYDRVVEMARSGELGHSDKCSQSEDYAIPSGLEALSTACVTVGSYSWFSVTFTPFDSYYRIVYIEEPDMITYTPACDKGDAAILRQLDENWFFCKGEWN